MNSFQINERDGLFEVIRARMLTTTLEIYQLSFPEHFRLNCRRLADNAVSSASQAPRGKCVSKIQNLLSEK